jgi:hypothetical protein
MNGAAPDSADSVHALDTLTARGADAARTIRLRAASVPGLAVAPQQNGALLRAVIVHTSSDIAGNARQGLADVVVEATLDAGRGAGQALGAIVVGCPAHSLPPQFAKAREGPAATIKERPRLFSSCSGRPGHQGKTRDDRINDRLHDSAAPWGADLLRSCRALLARLPFGQGRSLIRRRWQPRHWRTGIRITVPAVPQ